MAVEAAAAKLGLAVEETMVGTAAVVVAAAGRAAWVEAAVLSVAAVESAMEADEALAAEARVAVAWVAEAAPTLGAEAAAEAGEMTQATSTKARLIVEAVEVAARRQMQEASRAHSRSSCPRPTQQLERPCADRASCRASTRPRRM